MKKAMAAIAFLAVAFMGAFPKAGADSYVIPGSGVGTKITSVPYIITTRGFYYLSQNLTFKPISGTAIEVNADDVTLDLMGFCLTAADKSSDGIAISAGRSNVEIRNGSIRGFSGRGVYSVDNSCKGIRVTSLRVSNTGGIGIDLYGTDHLVMECSVKSAGSHGIYAGPGSLFKDNVVINNIDDGIRTSYGCNVVGNVAASNFRGIAVWPGSSVTDNTVYNNGADGIAAADNCTVTRNTAYFNAGTGITAGNYCTITNNTTDGLTYGSNCTTADNTVTP